MIRQDRFEVGDKVQFIPPDEYGYLPANIPHRHALKHGDGPYVVDAITNTPASYRAVAHTQIVEINGEEFSGWWFQPTR